MSNKTKPDDFKDYVEIHNYECPNCGEMPSDEPYFNGEPWPKYFNSSNHHSDLGHFYYWDEYHQCKTCDTKFWFQSGN